MSYTPLPTRTASDLNAAADVNLLQANIQAVIDDYIQPIGSTYIQFTDSSGSFQMDHEPASLFGGTWTKLWDSENVFFRTEGTNFQPRTNGLSQDQIQNITGFAQFTSSLSRFESSLTGAFYSSANDVRYNSSISGAGSYVYPRYLQFNASRVARAGAVTEPRNRLIRIWRRTA